MSGWTDERVEALKKLWVEDGLSASQIARKLGGVTRNGVIGKLHRMGLAASKVRLSASAPKRSVRATLPRDVKPTKAAPVPKNPSRANNLAAINMERRLAAGPKPDAKLPPLRCAEVESKPVRLGDREMGQCAYIIDDGDTCCGADTGGRRVSYCPGHTQLMSAGPGKPMNVRALERLGNVIIGRPGFDSTRPASVRSTEHFLGRRVA